MKTIIAFFFAAFVASTCLAQNQIQSQPNQGQEGGQGWYPQNSGSGASLGAVFFKNRDTGWASGYQFSLYTTNGGVNWQPYTPKVSVLRFIGSFGYGYSAKGAGWIATSINDGKTWNDYYTGYDNLSTFYFSTPSRGFGFFGLFGRIIRTLDGGKNWITDTTNVGTVTSFVCFDSLNVITGGYGFKPQPPTNNGYPAVFNTTDGGLTWNYAIKSPSQNTGLAAFGAFDSSTVYFIAGANTAAKSRNRGYTLEPINFPVGAFDPPYPSQAAYASDSNNITVVGVGGQIYRSYDGGSNWMQQKSNTKVTLNSLFFVDSANGWAVGDGGTILHTSNAGFSNVQTSTSFQSIQLNATPNPSATKITLSYILPLLQHVNLTIFDVSGKAVMNPLTNTLQQSGFQSLGIDTHSLPSGAYMVRLQTEKYQAVVNCVIFH